MIEIGRLCVKIAGRDAGKKCVVVDTLDKNYVLVDGETRRRKVNTAHLEPLDKTLKIEKGASHDKIVAVFKEIDIVITERKPKKAAPRPSKKVKAVATPTIPKVKPTIPTEPKKPLEKVTTKESS